MDLETILNRYRLRPDLFHVRLFHRMEKRNAASLLRRQRSRQLHNPYAESVKRRAGAFPPASSACFIVGRARRANNKNDEGRMVGIGISSGPLVRSRQFAIVDTKPIDADRSAHGPPRGNSDFKLLVWLVSDAYPAREATNYKRAKGDLSFMCLFVANFA